MSDQANENEGADPTDDIKKQNPGEKVSGDAGGDSSAKTQDLTSRADLDPEDAEE